jgi:cation:H+ antiporter
MILSLLAVLGGLVLLVWSADRFVEGSTAVARHAGLSPLLIGMLIVGFGTSAPEMAVSVLAALQDNSGLALGNAYGSNITNIALILGVTALIRPIAVQSSILRKELPILAGLTLLSGILLWNGYLSRLDALVLLVLFCAIFGWSILQGVRRRDDNLADEMAREVRDAAMPIRRAAIWLVVGLVLLIASSRLLVWGAVRLAQDFGVNDLVIGLTIVAIGTSLPELASSVAAARKGENDLALGNVLGSNLFNTLAVVGLAAVINPVAVGPDVLRRDVLLMGGLTLALFVVGYGFRGLGTGRVNRVEGGVLVAVYLAYVAWLLSTV